MREREVVQMTVEIPTKTSATAGSETLAAGGTEVADGSRTTYRRVLATRRGGPDVLELVEEPVPEPALSEARLRVLAAGVGFPDILMREGTDPRGTTGTCAPR